MRTRVNVDDLSISLDLARTLVRLKMYPMSDYIVEELNSQFEIIKYRSHETINDTYGGKYESDGERKEEPS